MNDDREEPTMRDILAAIAMHAQIVRGQPVCNSPEETRRYCVSNGRRHACGAREMTVANTLIPPPERASDALFERHMAENIHEIENEVERTLIEQVGDPDCQTEAAYAYLDWRCEQLGYGTPEQFVAMIRKADAEIWRDAVDREVAASYWRGRGDCDE